MNSAGKIALPQRFVRNVFIGSPPGFLSPGRSVQVRPRTAAESISRFTVTYESSLGFVPRQRG